MSGSLHVFRRDVVNGEPFYQINYNETGRTFAQVVDRNYLEEFLAMTAALPDDVIDSAIRELDNTGKAHVLDVRISEGELVGSGMIESPSEF